MSTQGELIRENALYGNLLYVVPTYFSGPCFLDYLDGLPSIDRDIEGPVRVVISDRYSDMGVIAMGKVESGVVLKNQDFILMPNKVRSLSVFSGFCHLNIYLTQVPIQVLQMWMEDDEIESAASGQNIKLRLKGVDEEDILSGFVICALESLCHVGKVFDAQVKNCSRDPL